MKDPIQEVVFVKSSPNYRDCPPGELPEYAFIGRSNVGKSSLINYLTQRDKLARTSNQPGRTRLINHFLVNNSWYLVDLPGYGYAKIAKTERSKLSKVIYDYIRFRRQLTCLFLLIDIRHDPLSADLEFIRWLGLDHIPFALCFTKIDKLSAQQLVKNVDYYKKTLLTEWEFLPSEFYTSTLKKQGRDEILSFIDSTNKRIVN